MIERLARPLPLLLLGLLLVLAATWPAVTVLGRASMTDLAEPDYQAGLWWPSAFTDALLAGRNPFRATELAWPHGQDVRLIGVAFGWFAQLLALPVHALTGPVLGMDLVTLATMLVNGLCCAWAGRASTGSPAGALAGLAVGATNAYAWVEGGFGRPEQAAWGPAALYLGAIVRLQAAPGERRTRWIGAAGLALSGMIYPFYAYFLGLLSLLAAPFLLRRGSLRDLLFIGGVAAVAELLVISPILAQLVQDDRVFQAIATGSGDQHRAKMNASILASGFLGPFSWGRTYVAARAPLLLLPLVVAGLWKGPRGVKAVAFMALSAAVFAAGPVLAGDGGGALKIGGKVLQLPAMLLDGLPGYRRMWWPYRWLGVLTPAVALLAAWALARLRAGPVAVLVFSAWCVFEGAQTARSGLRPGEALFRPISPPPVFADLAAGPPAPILMVPLSRMLNGMVGWQAFHRQPISSGLCWHMPGIRQHPPALLEREVERALLGEAVEPRRWSEPQAGGFHKVMLRKDPAGMLPQEVERLSRLFGKPLYEDAELALWAVPGMGGPGG